MLLSQVLPLRHTVRRFRDIPIHAAKAAQLQYEIDRCNAQYGTHIQLVTDDPQVFAGKKAFSNANNYIALIGSKKQKPQEILGYCGELLVLKAQAIQLNTCWVAATYRKRKVKATVLPGEKLYAVIAVGVGEDQGAPHKRRKRETRQKGPQPLPMWFQKGVHAAMLAPTALHRQNFCFTLLENDTVALRSKGVCKKLNAGILKYHFEIGAGDHSFRWSE